MGNDHHVIPFKNCPPLDGYHCQTNSLAKIYNYHGYPISEDMLLGLGAGMGFIYWKMKMGSDTYVFVGGRGNNKSFFEDIGQRTGVKINSVSTSSSKKAEAALQEKLAAEEPVMLFGDMAFLPWFDFPDDYHFGGHTFTVCGHDSRGSVLASDMDPATIGLKKGFYSTITLEQLKKARSSLHKPFPPNNTYLEFDFSYYREPGPEEIYAAIEQVIDAQLNPPIKNLGVKGIRHTAKEILKWPGIFDDYNLRMNLFSIYIYFEIGGTGGGCFRYMYSRFLKEAADITGNLKLLPISEKMYQVGLLFSEVGRSFINAEKDDNLAEKIRKASNDFNEIAVVEEEAYISLSQVIK